MSDDVIDLIRGVNPFPDELPAPPIEPVLRRLEGGDQGSRSPARRQLRANLDAMIGALGAATAVAVAVFAIALLGHTRSRTAAPNAATSTTTAASTRGAAPGGQDNLTGTWRGHYSGTFGIGTLTISWQQSGWKETSPGIWHSNLNGSMTLSNPVETLPIGGTVVTNCRQAPCYHGDLIEFRTVEPAAFGGTWGWYPQHAIVYTARVSARDLHGSYQTPSGNNGGVWSARKLPQ